MQYEALSRCLYFCCPSLRERMLRSKLNWLLIVLDSTVTVTSLLSREWEHKLITHIEGEGDAHSGCIGSLQ